MLTHVYDLSQPYPRPPAHFRAHTLISDPPPYSNSISFVTTCFHAFPTSVDCLRTPQRVANRPHAFSRQSAPFFYLFFAYFHHFWSFSFVFLSFSLIFFTISESYFVHRPLPNHFRDPLPIFELHRSFLLIFNYFLHFWPFSTIFKPYTSTLKPFASSTTHS